jgi:histidine triad (HIT) family protein
MSCIFCEIAAGTLPAEIVWRGEGALAFLDNRPLFPGHVLLIPDRHIETLSELPLEAVGPLFEAAQKIERAVVAAMKAEGSFVAMNNRVSQSVPHLHVHIVPRTKGDGLKGFFWPRRLYSSPDHMAEVGAAIHHSLMIVAQSEPRA